MKTTLESFEILLRISGCRNFSGPSRNGPDVTEFTESAVLRRVVA